MYQTTNPGLAPWAMQVYRPYRAPLRLPYHFIILMRLCPVGDRAMVSIEHALCFSYDAGESNSMICCVSLFIFCGRAAMQWSLEKIYVR